jgi:hypothetical protein
VRGGGSGGDDAARGGLVVMGAGCGEAGGLLLFGKQQLWYEAVICGRNK